MKKIIIVVLGLLIIIPSQLFAEYMPPDVVVQALIDYAQKNDLNGVLGYADLVKIASHPRHAMQPKEFIDFLKNIELDKIEFEKMNWGPDEKMITVRIIKPISYDFDLEKISTPKDITCPRFIYRVISVHP